MTNKPTKRIPTPDQLPVFEYRGQPMADSRDVAAMVDKNHYDLLRDIRGYIEIMGKRGERKIAASDFFIASSFVSSQNKEMPCYYLTEMGCDMVAHKQTGEKGVLFTARYVKAFHKMRSFITERSSPLWKDTRSMTKEVRRQETDAIKALVDYATAQGSKNASRYYSVISTLADSTVGITDRDSAHMTQLTILLMAEKAIAATITQGIRAGVHYKNIYQSIKVELTPFRSVAAAGCREE